MGDRILTYTNRIDELGVIGGISTLTPAQPIDSRRDHRIGIISASMPSKPANIYDATAMLSLPVAERVNTGKYRASRNGGTDWTVLQISTAAHCDLESIEKAINDSLQAWYTTIDEPALRLLANGSLLRCYAVIDSTKLAAPGQFAIDFAYDGSKLGEVLGFVTPALFDADGTHTADQYANIDWLGSSLSIELSNFGSLSVVNGVSSARMITMPLPPESYAQNTFTYPACTGEQPFTVPCEINSSNLSEWTVIVRGARGQLALAFGKVDCHVTIRIIEE